MPRHASAESYSEADFGLVESPWPICLVQACAVCQTWPIDGRRGCIPRLRHVLSALSFTRTEPSPKSTALPWAESDEFLLPNFTLIVSRCSKVKLLYLRRIESMNVSCAKFALACTLHLVVISVIRITVLMGKHRSGSRTTHKSKSLIWYHQLVDVLVDLCTVHVSVLVERALANRFLVALVHGISV
jgi:hypothetical protein